MKDYLANEKTTNYFYLALIGLVIGVAVFHFMQWTLLVDDSFISFRVVRNWLEYGIPIYNPGQVEWVPSNYLWVVLLALGQKMSSIEVSVLGQTMGGVSGLLIVVLLLFNPIKSIPKEIKLYSALLCAVSPLWAVWPLSGLETSLAALLITLGVILFMHYQQNLDDKMLAGAGFFLGLAVLTRAEAFLVFLICFFILIVSSRKTPVHVFLFAGVCLFICALGYSYLWVQFKEIFPSSYYAKVQGVANFQLGKDYLKRWVVDYKLWLLAPLLIAPLLVKKHRVLYVSLITVLAMWLVWVGWVGGDFMPFFRFIAPVWPLFCLVLALGVNTTWKYCSDRWPVYSRIITLATGIYALIPLACFIWPALTGVDHDQLRSWVQEERDRAQIGRWLARQYSKQDWLAVKPAGRIPYYSGMKVLDFYCLTNRQAAISGHVIPENWVGHQKINLNWIFETMPKVIILDEHLYAFETLPQPDSGDGAIERAWRQDIRHDHYQVKRVPMTASNRWLQYFEKREATGRVVAE